MCVHEVVTKNLVQEQKMVLGPLFAAKNGPSTKLCPAKFVLCCKIWSACLLIGLPIILWTYSAFTLATSEPCQTGLVPVLKVD